ncbi:hypothetical protein XENOCAPTIV_026053 [Xenoophorus captivus]|uniref:EGF-like domain-containing protein n=1 Tax=Xenoophorus captivus TaxID=1517983 RepID=A0ABV0QN13_9TELE
MCPKIFYLCVKLFSAMQIASSADLQPGMPNVCTNQEVSMLGIRQPCVKGFTRMVKVWKQGCTGHRWCVGYERRTTYYTAYRQAYSMDFHTVYQCCPGWTQKNNEMGCLHRVCSANACLNGGRCVEMGNHVCRCPLGFKGLQCQYGNYFNFTFKNTDQINKCSGF